MVNRSTSGNLIGGIGCVLLVCMVPLNKIQRTGDFRQRLTADMQVDHGGGQSAMTHQDLDFADIVPGFQKMSGKAMPVMPSSA